jgi:hypothetical protein
VPVPSSHADTAAGSTIEPLNRFAYALLTNSQLPLSASLGRAVM